MNYVTGECIVTSGCLSKSGALRWVIKSLYIREAVLPIRNRRITLAMGTNGSDPDLL